MYYSNSPEWCQSHYMVSYGRSFIYIWLWCQARIIWMGLTTQPPPPPNTRTFSSQEIFFLKFTYHRKWGKCKNLSWKEGIEDVVVHHGLGFSWYLEDNFCLFVCFLWVCPFQKRCYVPEFVNELNPLIQNIPMP